MTDPGIARDGKVTDTNVSTTVREPPFNPMISYPFPVETGRRFGNLLLPQTLERADANRLAAFVQTLVVSRD